MRYLIVSALCLALIGMPLAGLMAQQETGLVAHYTFDEGSGGTARDVSGNGNDGKIFGAVYVPSPRGHALKFDGLKSFVDLGMNPIFNISGDMSFEAWVKVDPTGNVDGFIFGDTASLAVNRNFYISANNKRLRMEYGNSSAAGQLISHEAVFDGTWQHVALVCEYPYYHMYINGREVSFGEMTLPITRTEITPHHIGGWWWEKGYFKGEIDEICVYSRAISESTIRERAGAASGDSNRAIQTVVPSLHFGLQKLDVKVLCKNIKPGSDKLDVTISRKDGKPVLSRSVPAQESRPGTERGVLMISFDTKALKPGEYNVQTAIADRSGKLAAAPVTTRLTYPTRPEWYKSKAGISNKVQAPYTPIRVEKGNGVVSMQVWGRTYDFGSDPFLAGVRSQGQALLAGPVRLTGRVNGADLVLKPGSPVVKAGTAKSVISRTFTGNGVEIAVRTTLEYDGLVWFDWKVRGKQAASIDNLTVEIPFDAGHAKYVYSWRGTSYQTGNGALKQDSYDWEFRPMVWFGDDKTGMQWIAESDQNWSPAEPGKAMQVVKQGGEVVLRLNLVQKPTELKPGKPLAYGFGFEATPVKPIEKDAWDYHFNHVSQKTHVPADQGIRLTDAILDELKAKGVRTLCIHEHWTTIQGYTKTPHEKDLSSLVKRVHQRGMKILLYFGFNTSDLMPEWPYIGDECVVYPKSGYIPYNYPPQPLQNAYITCLHSPYQDLLADGIARLVDRFGIDGVYLDTTTAPFACTNPLHGCGYRRPDGSIAPTFPVLSVRSTLKRMYTVIRQRKPDGLVDAHVFDAMNVPALAFATSVFDGEQLQRQAFFPDGLPLDRFRAEFMGVQWGVPVEVMEYMLGGGYKGMLAISLLHDVPCRVAGLGDNFELDSKLWKIMDDFGRKESKWLPYYENSGYVSVTAADCYVSFRQHPKNGLLAIVSNLGKTDANVEVSFNLSKLGLSAVSAEDAVSGKQVSITDGKMTIFLPSTNWTILRVKPQ